MDNMYLIKQRPYLLHHLAKKYHGMIMLKNPNGEFMYNEFDWMRRVIS